MENKKEKVEVKKERTKVIVDLGNSNLKMLAKGKKVVFSSNVERVAKGEYGAMRVGDDYFKFGESVERKKNTDKICDEKRALLGKCLFKHFPDKTNLKVVTLLPLSLFIVEENKHKYAELLKGKYVIEGANGEKKSFTVSEVEICAESFSALMTNGALRKKPLYLVDIGGVDLTMVYVNKTPSTTKIFTHEQGVNIFYQELGTKLTAVYRQHFSDDNSEQFFKKYSVMKGTPQKEIIDEFTKNYIEKNIYTKLKGIGYMPDLHQVVYVGGGAKDLEEYLLAGKEEGKDVLVLDNAVMANVQGAEILSDNKERKLAAMGK